VAPVDYPSQFMEMCSTEALGLRGPYRTGGLLGLTENARGETIYQFGYANDASWSFVNLISVAMELPQGILG